MHNKIAVEEHFELPGEEAAGNNAFDPAYLQDVRRRLTDRDLRLRTMDECGIALSVLSLTEPGVQGVADAREALSLAQRVNDHIAEFYVGAHPRRFAGLAAVPLQDARAAADELERSVRQLGLKGAMVNGFTTLGDGDAVRYLDDPACDEFWARAESLDVPVYLHPRVPLPSQRRALQDYPALAGSPWGFGRETAEHAVRLILGGVFDRYPRLTFILGHLGEGLLFALPRMEKRLRHQSPGTHGRHERPVTEYLRTNILLSTSGIQHTQALQNALLEVGADRLLFAVDYPFESMAEIAPWFDACAIAEADRAKIGRRNAERAFKLDA